MNIEAEFVEVVRRKMKKKNEKKGTEKNGLTLEIEGCGRERMK